MVILCDPVFYSDISSWLSEEVVYPFREDEEPQVFLADRFAGPFLCLFNPAVELKENLPVRDHLNLTGDNPLRRRWGDPTIPRFPDMSRVYRHSGEGCLIVFGHHPALADFPEKTIPVRHGLGDVLYLAARQKAIHGWVVGDLPEMYQELVAFKENANGE